MNLHYRAAGPFDRGVVVDAILNLFAPLQRHRGGIERGREVGTLEAFDTGDGQDTVPDVAKRHGLGLSQITDVGVGEGIRRRAFDLGKLLNLLIPHLHIVDSQRGSGVVLVQHRLKIEGNRHVFTLISLQTYVGSQFLPVSHTAGSRSIPRPGQTRVFYIFL